MKTPPVVHGTFHIERTYNAPPARVFAAWADIETKARWFIGPPDKWKVVERALDFRVGGQERLHGQLASGSNTIFTARYHDIIPNQRLVYVYDMQLGDRHLSVSLATVELSETSRGGTRMKFTEQATFLDDEYGVASREEGTAAHFDRLLPVLEDPCEIISSRVFDAPRERVFGAFTDPNQLARFWGPKGFTNTFHEFDLRTGGTWRLTMHGPDGSDYPNEWQFLALHPPERVLLHHLKEMHRFKLALTFVSLGEKTQLIWRMQFESKAEADAVRAYVPAANEQNFDRLAVHLQSAGMV